MTHEGEIEVLFWCLPPDSKCEWANLRRFVDDYNSAHGTAYSHTACLDVSERNSRQPEVRLDSPGEPSLVIERKSVAWPSGEYFADHRHEHQLGSLVQNRIHAVDDSFSESLFQLTLSALALKGRKKTEIRATAGQIADHILSSRDAAKSQRGVRGQQPIPWHFGPARFVDEDERPPGAWFRVQVEDVEPDFGSSPDEFRRQRASAKRGYAAEFLRCAEAAARKFAAYGHCRRVLVVQFFGSGMDDRVSDDDLVEIVRTGEIPTAIDEVWVAYHEWVSAWDYEVAWRHVR